MSRQKLPDYHSPFGWIGSKRKMIPILQQFIPPHFNTYYEPFLGGGALYFALSPQKAILSDIDSNLINKWRHFQDDPLDFIHQVDQYEKYLFQYPGRANIPLQQTRFNQMLTEYNESTTKNGALFFVLVKYTFRGIFRYRKKDGRLLASYGFKANSFTPLTRSKYLPLAKQLQAKGQIFNADFETTINHAQAGDFVFVDPPYDSFGTNPKKQRIDNTSWFNQPFNQAEQTRLAQTLIRAHQRGVKFLHTNYPTPHIKHLYRQFNQTLIRGTTQNKTTKRQHEEIIITNY
ncbi:DNA adenine methylase [Candidatus Phytoplasma pruni]|uniref:site-specific DNA-methyltransferase (adenine-specific) n=1 Tax=Candidatus Phytoplasma pruni TaxID=479893 RepID=A0A851HBZ2_9MOLU|nr:DNA adenine methylase [Candidatus Phytoplasma pruni]NWN45595.1 DNA adenine methylase [Candidatus Phytoplasma pruni]